MTSMAGENVEMAFPSPCLLFSCVPETSEEMEMTPVGFEPTQLALVELESTPLDHSGKVSVSFCLLLQVNRPAGWSLSAGQ